MGCCLRTYLEVNAWIIGLLILMAHSNPRARSTFQARWLKGPIRYSGIGFSPSFGTVHALILTSLLMLSLVVRRHLHQCLNLTMDRFKFNCTMAMVVVASRILRSSASSTQESRNRTAWVKQMDAEDPSASASQIFYSLALYAQLDALYQKLFMMTSPMGLTKPSGSLLKSLGVEERMDSRMVG